MPAADPSMAPRGPVPAAASPWEALPGQSGPVEALENPKLTRHDRVGRRESRLGLRGLFGRSRASKEGKETKAAKGTNQVDEVKASDVSISSASTAQSSLSVPKTLGLRASVADLSPWSTGHQSETALSQPRSTQALSNAFASHADDPSRYGSLGRQGGAKYRSVTPLPQPPPTLATWEMPPLFKAYPQAIIHASLPSSTLSADAILRLNDKKSSANTHDDGSAVESNGGDKPKSKSKSRPKHRRNTSGSGMSLEWTDKIYVLVTSGALLQYSGDGHFDRLPEKVLRLGPSSAAFASDVIPGRHWVVQVSSSTDTDGPGTPDSRSLFSRLQFRGAERRTASNLLLVLDAAEDLERWITTLRCEIEKLGGKKKLSETGKPKEDEKPPHLREQGSQRTLIVRDPARYSQNYMPGGWQKLEAESRVSDCSEAATDPDTGLAPSLDDISSTNSVVSHDGRQLENLRDSSNRLSYLSSGQRTIVTSAGSSPAASPIVDSFPRNSNEKLHPVETSNTFEARPRPNASSIASRRQSMQSTAPFVEPGPRSQLNCVITKRVDGDIAPLGGQTTPNFSVPHSSTRRFSYFRAQTPELGHSPPRLGGNEMASRPAERKPPTTLRVARPLSMVVDQPSPRDGRDGVAERPNTGHDDSSSGSPTKGQNRSHLQSRFRSRTRVSDDVAARRSSFIPRDAQSRAAAPTSPRKMSSLGALRKYNEAAPKMCSFTPTGSPLMSRDTLSSPSRSPPPVSYVDESRRRRSSMGVFEGNRNHSPAPSSRAAKRCSMQSTISERSNRSLEYQYPVIMESLRPAAPPPSAPLPALPASASNPHLKINMTAKSLFNRRSMPQLAAEGPPPAPPPMRALPPIPGSKQVRA